MDVIVFTNGCFDIIHPGHIDRSSGPGNSVRGLLSESTATNRSEGSRVTGGRFFPLTNQKAVLLGLRSVDEVIVFDEPTPDKLIKEIRPDVLVKGGDWKTGEIIGSDSVLQNGGKVYSLPLKVGYSSSGIVERIRSVDKEPGLVSEAANSEDLIGRSLSQHIDVLQKVIHSQSVDRPRVRRTDPCCDSQRKQDPCLRKWRQCGGCPTSRGRVCRAI